jgi:hypothetical protein
MNIVDHGKWLAYQPNPIPDNAPANAIFARRESDGVDWYSIVHGSTPVLPASSVKFTGLWNDTYSSYVVSVATYDGTLLFPAGQILQEITDYTGSDPQADFGGKLYDPATGAFTDPPPPPPALDAQSVLDRIAALEAKARG